MTKKKKVAPAGTASTILALKRPTPPSTDERSVVNDAPSPPPLPEKPSIEVAENTPDTQVTEPKPKPKIPPLVTLPEATNASGEVFKVGDQILVSAPWGGKAIAEIMLIYQGGEGAWVEYKPIGSVKEGWQWERGNCSGERANNPTFRLYDPTLPTDKGRGEERG